MPCHQIGRRFDPGDDDDIIGNSNHVLIWIEPHRHYQWGDSDLSRVGDEINNYVQVIDRQSTLLVGEKI
jgi:hypothetical protein